MKYVSRHYCTAKISLGLNLFQFPKICREEVSIHVIQSREHILNTVCCSIPSPQSYISLTKNSILRKYRNLQRSATLLSLTDSPDSFFLLHRKNFVEMMSTLLHLLGRHSYYPLELSEETNLVSN